MKNKYLTVLMYHGVGNIPKTLSDSEALYWVHSSEFRRQIEYISKSNTKIVNYPEWLNKDICLNDNQVMITFDDGAESIYKNAFPILAKHNMTAAIFLSVNDIGSPGFLSWAQVKDLSDKGFYMGSHGMHHIFMNDLSSVQKRTELMESKSIIEKSTGKTVDIYSPPGGRIDSETISIAKFCGYNAIFTSKPSVNGIINSRFLYHRFAIKRNTGISGFTDIVSNNSSTLVRLRIKYLLLNLVKKMMGNYNYLKLHEIVSNRL